MSYQLQITGSQLEEKLTPSYGEISVNDNSTSQSIPTGSTYTKLTCFDTNGQSSGSVADSTNDKITIDKAGDYKINGSFSMLSGTGNVTYYCTVFINDIEIDPIHFNRKISTAGDVGSASFSGIVNVSSDNLDIDVRIRHNYASDVDVTISYANLSVIKIN